MSRGKKEKRLKILKEQTGGREESCIQGEEDQPDRQEEEVRSYMKTHFIRTRKKDLKRKERELDIIMALLFY